MKNAKKRTYLTAFLCLFIAAQPLSLSAAEITQPYETTTQAFEPEAFVPQTFQPQTFEPEAFTPEPNEPEPLSANAEAVTLLRAVAAQGGLYTLPHDITVDDNILFIRAPDFVLDLNGHQLTVNATDFRGRYSGIVVSPNAVFTVKDSSPHQAGALVVYGFQENNIFNSGPIAAIVLSQGALVVESGHINTIGGRSGLAGVGDVTVNGGTLTAQGRKVYPISDIYVENEATGISVTTLTVNGGEVRAQGENSKTRGANGITADVLTINGGHVTAVGGTGINHMTYGAIGGFGISTKQLTLTGGTLEATGGSGARSTNRAGGWIPNRATAFDAEAFSITLPHYRFWQSNGVTLGEADIKEGLPPLMALNGTYLLIQEMPATPPVIMSQPASVSVAAGQGVTFFVTADGQFPLTYQWQQLHAGGNWENLYQADKPSFTMAFTSVGQNGALFRCLVTNPLGTTQTEAATLTVTADSDDLVEAFVARLYHLVLERKPEPEGFYFWVSGLQAQHITATQTAYEFIDSFEFSNKNLTHEQFLSILYFSFLDRAPETDGMLFWLNTLQLDYSRAFVVDCFINSIEFEGICAQYQIIK